MCDPLTIATLGVSAISGILSLSQPTPTPPKPAAPAAVAAPTARDGGATVLVGAGKTDNLDSAKTTETPMSFTEKRLQGVALGGLGRSGLAL